MLDVVAEMSGLAVSVGSICCGARVVLDGWQAARATMIIIASSKWIACFSMPELHCNICAEDGRGILEACLFRLSSRSWSGSLIQLKSRWRLGRCNWKGRESWARGGGGCRCG
jgi:hypothetical protein